MIDQLAILDSPWHIISSALVFFLGLSYAFLQRTFVIPRPTAILLYLWHTFCCIFYLNYSLENSADSTGYYARSFILDQDFGLNTVGIDYFTSIFSDILGMSYLGVFLVNNILGYIGLLALAAALTEVARGKEEWVRKLAVLMAFLPGASFWSTAIGKDSLTFMGAGLAAWAFLNLERRYRVLAITAAAFLFARPHMAALLLAAAFFAIVLLARIPKGQKIGLSLAMLPLLVFGVISGAALVGLDTDASVQELNEAVEYRQSVNMDGGSSINIAEMSIFMRMFAFVFRPFFVDANGILGLAASFENFLFLGLALLAVKTAIKERSSLPKVALWFFVIYAGMSWLVLGNTITNMGLALRQKWMFMPMLMLLWLSYAPSFKRKPVVTGRRHRQL